MKNEDEKMQEYMKDFTNAHGNLPKSKWIDPVFHFSKNMLKVAIVIGIVIFLIMVIPLSIQVYNQSATILFTMDKRTYIKKIEKTYNQKLEVIEDYSSYKGNGTIILRTKKQPIVEFRAVKTIREGSEAYYLEYEGKALLYYMDNGEEDIFKNLEVQEDTAIIVLNDFKKEEITKYIGYLKIESYDKIEEAVHQLIEIKKAMTQRLKQFKIPLYLKIGDYISSYDYPIDEAEEDIILKEKQSYYWDLKSKGKDISFIPESDLSKNINIEFDFS